MSSGPCVNVNWGAFCSRLVRDCVAGSIGQGCEGGGGRCGTCYRARARTEGPQPILEYFAGCLVYVITSPDILADEGLQAGDFIRQIDGEEVSKALITAASKSVEPLKLRYYRPGLAGESEVEVPGLGNVAGFIGLALSTPGPLASRGIGLHDAVTHINNESVSPQLFIDLADDPEGEAMTLIYRDFTFAARTLTL